MSTQQKSGVLSFVLRSLGYLAFWAVLAGFDAKDLVVGLASAMLAAWLSLQLLPPGGPAIRPLKALALFFRFLVQSVTAGLAVARIAVTPAMPLKPGLVEFTSTIPAGNQLYAFMTLAGLLPGTLPVRSDERGAVVVHCLDSDQPVEQQLTDEEARFTSALSKGATA
jgi:multicomponent Na+:H+ antiporter subunit E